MFKQSFAQKSIYWIKVISLGIILGLGVQFAEAWTNPTVAPPGGNVSAPLTTGTTGQSKSGNLAINTAGIYQNALLIPNGRVGIGVASPAEKFEVNGNVKATAFLYASDRRLKENIIPLSDSLSKIRQLNGYSFQWKEDYRDDVGIIAQEVEAQFPTIVRTNEETGMKSVEYGNLVAPLIEAVKELSHTVDAQGEKIRSLQAEVESLKSNKQSSAFLHEKRYPENVFYRQPGDDWLRECGACHQYSP